ncbi:FimV/HubP family polar landmark protein [Pseudoxanthomonas indica]|uniref:Pilus assembly protein FimV n=1 Tax=Pseudoxanthomonas indica TaxID=428993 RepID=A0A1T5J0E3_9GAMM|nr:pilus assembly protein FimV [Pseudoxanthomonas indica]
MPSRRHRWRAVAGLALMLLSSSVLALGLGEIRVKSSPGQPLLAEIPIISTEPGELEQLRAQLASPATFERVGLPRPQGLVGDLEFNVALDDAGRPVIRVTSQAPVTVSVVNFLIEVDWGQGRLVREYAAMVDAPSTVAAASQPAIEAPQVARDNVIERPAAAATSEPPSEPAPVAPTPEAAPDARVASAPPAPAPAAPAPAPSFDGGDSLTVARGQTLSQIAAQVASGYSIDQTMIALLRANPEAFIRGNINRLKQGAVLRVPPSGDVAQLGESEAAALVRSQIAEWRQARRPIPQPAAIANNEPTTTAAPRVADARLEIAPPLASAATRAGTQSGVDAGGEGDMLANEQLQQSKEELAARDAEVQELRSQVAELEKLKQQQSKLIAMKDSDLAAAQQRLEQSNGATAGTPIWVWAGWGLLIIGALAWILSSRRKRVAPTPAKPSKVFGNAELAAAMPARVEPATATPAAAATVSDERVEPVLATAPAAAVASASAAAAKPAKAAKAPAAPAKPTWHSGDAVASVAPLNSSPAGRERLELAIAYLDLGDTVTARDLLNEVVAGNDDVARQEALQLLRELG